MAAVAQQVSRRLRTSEVLSALSYALDITEGQPPGHAIRSCLIGMRLADELQLDDGTRSALFYALLLKDAGCSSNAAKICTLFRTDDLRFKQGVKTVDWASFSDNLLWLARSVAPDGSPFARAAALVRLGLQQGTAREIFETRCERGAEIALELGFTEQTAAAIRTLDEHWDGHGQPFGLAAHEIPLLGRIVCLAQTVDVFASTQGLAAAYASARERRGAWFDPELVCALEAFEGDSEFWSLLDTDDLDALVSAIEPPDRIFVLDDAALDRVAGAFARVIDAKSPSPRATRSASQRSRVAVGVALGLTAAELRRLSHAALLHDIGKLGVSNLILDKPGRLTDEERAAVELHPSYTRGFLSRVEPFPGARRRRCRSSREARRERLSAGTARRRADDDCPDPGRRRRLRGDDRQPSVPRAAPR